MSAGERLVELLTQMDDRAFEAQGEWAPVDEVYAPEWTHPLKVVREQLSELEDVLIEMGVLLARGAAAGQFTEPYDRNLGERPLYRGPALVLTSNGFYADAIAPEGDQSIAILNALPGRVWIEVWPNNTPETAGEAVQS